MKYGMLILTRNGQYRGNYCYKRDESFSVFYSLLASLFDSCNGLTSVLGAKDRTASHHPVSTALSNQVSVVRTDSSVDLNVQRGELFVEVTNFIHHAGDEFLSSEARLDSHHKHFVDAAVSNQLLDGGIYWSFGAEGETDFHIAFMDEIANLLEVSVLTFIMESETVHSDFGHLVDVIARVGDVHVAVEVGFRQVLSHPGDDGGTNGEVRHEMSASATNYPSMTSMWRESAPKFTTCSHSLASSPKSADRMEGPKKTWVFLA